MHRFIIFTAFATLVATPVLTAPLSAQPEAAATDIEGEAPIARWVTFDPVPVSRKNSASGFDFTSNFVTANQAPEGDLPRELAITPDGSTVVIVNRDTNNMTFMDIDTRVITDTVELQNFPVHVAVTPDGQFAVAPNVLGDSVSVVDLETRTLVANVPVSGQQPYRVAVTSDSQCVVVGVINDAVNSSFSVIDLNTMTEVLSFPSVAQGVIGFFFTPETGASGNLFTQFALANDSTTLVLPDRGNDQVAVYDITNGSQSLIPTADAPTAVDVSDDSTLAVISHEGLDQLVSVIDLSTISVSDTWATPDTLRNQIIRITPDRQFAIAAILNSVVFVNLNTGATTTLSTGTVGDIELSFDGQYAFVSNFNARVIDLATLSIVQSIPFRACAEAATSPTELRAVALNNRFREDVQVYNIDGASGFFEGRALSGQIEEGDATRTLAFTPDGSRIVAANVTSDNVCIIDATSGLVEAYVPTGERSLGIAVSPDGTTAVVANAEDNHTSILDIASGTNLVNLPTSQRPAEVAISPDGQRAFVTSIAGTDRIHFIDLDGANSSVTGSLVAGQMGSILYTYNVVSGIAVSPDGNILAACISFDDELLLVDTATQSEIARVPVGDFPIRVAFSADGNLAFVTHSFSDDLYIVSIDGGSSQVEAVVPGIEFPLDVVVSGDGSHAYVASFDFNAPSVKVVATSTGTVVNTVVLNDQPRRLYLCETNSILYAMTTAGELVRIAASGPTSSVIDSTSLSAGGSDLDFNEATLTAVVAQPIPDGVDIVREILLGDVNRDGFVSLLDVAPFVDLLSQGGFQLEADINQDGVVSLLDVSLFVDLLSGP